MGLELHRTYVRPDAAGRAGFLTDYEKDPGPEGFALVQYEDLPGEFDDFGALRNSRAYGEAIHVTTFDGTELTGVFFYEHAIRGRVLRALAYSPKLFTGRKFENLQWERIEGAPEPWETGIIPAGITVGAELPEVNNDDAAMAVIRYWALPEPPPPRPRYVPPPAPPPLAPVLGLGPGVCPVCLLVMPPPTRHVTPAQVVDIAALLARHDMLAANKLVRTVSGFGLEEAKRYLACPHPTK